MTDPHHVSVRLIGRGCEHELCVPIRRGVPPELRCETKSGYGSGSGAPCGCRTPEDLVEQVTRKLRDDLQEMVRLGFVPIHAA